MAIALPATERNADSSLPIRAIFAKSRDYVYGQWSGWKTAESTLENPLEIFLRTLGEVQGLKVISHPEESPHIDTEFMILI